MCLLLKYCMLAYICFLQQYDEITFQNIPFFKFRASGDFWILLLTFANKLDPDQVKQNIWRNLGPNCFDTVTVFLKDFLKKVSKICKWQKSMQNNPVYKELCITFEPRHEISNNVVCVTSKASDQAALMCSLIRVFASRLNILWVLSYWLNTIWCF